MRLVDIGANLGHGSFDRDREQVIARALGVGVRQIVVTGSSIAGSRRAQQLAARRPDVLFATAGVHPHDTRHCDDNTLAALRDLARQPEVVALGECGLDYNRDFSPRPIQDRWFDAQLQLACELQKPLFLHQRDAHERFIALLKPYTSEIGPVVVHCFTGAQEELEEYLALGFYIGITGWICDERRGAHLRDLVKLIPLDRLMLETDAPFLMPRTIRPRPHDSRNQPSFLPYVLTMVAASLDRTPDTVAEATTRTSQKFFGLPVAARGDLEGALWFDEEAL